MHRIVLFVPLPAIVLLQKGVERVVGLFGTASDATKGKGSDYGRKGTEPGDQESARLWTLTSQSSLL